MPFITSLWLLMNTLNWTGPKRELCVLLWKTSSHLASSSVTKLKIRQFNPMCLICFHLSTVQINERTLPNLERWLRTLLIPENILDWVNGMKYMRHSNLHMYSQFWSQSDTWCLVSSSTSPLGNEFFWKPFLVTLYSKDLIKLFYKTVSF